MKNFLHLTTSRFVPEIAETENYESVVPGQDFITWLWESMKPLTGSLVTFEEPFQDDCDWGFWAIGADDDTFWVSVRLLKKADDGNGALWRVGVEWHTGWNLLKRWFGKPDVTCFEQLWAHVTGVLNAAADISVQP
jgi:hypothetical protein